MTEPKIHNDNWTLDDLIGHKDHVKSVANTIEQCDPPYVLGIHGDWGAGKTSFLRKLHLYFAGEGCGYDGAKDNYTNLFGNKCTGKPDIETIWFDAWHYQFETNPVVALLNEIRAHFALSKSFFDKAEKLSYAAIMSLDDLAKKIGASPSKIMAAGEKWEKDHYAQPLPSQMIKDLMEDAISKLLGKKHRLVIFVDDLDRSEKPKISPEDEASETIETIYESIFPDPSDESLFRAAKLIRERAVPEKDELNVYTLRGNDEIKNNT
ncbi:KAP family P-loop domain-containing protein [Desulfonema limicola]|uniref:KAP family P-loop domain-containing protein n=1 Tax=Desulfonema limicola TaxID=45656 RepID=A0A975GIZ4_9BACT|nr:P-loop NTPase fold protein [Desulfonema limicola]QTA83067.1 KAP family P-loop domain-containing protein [Desulfonema limicola]